MAQGESNPFFYFICWGKSSACSRALSIVPSQKEFSHYGWRPAPFSQNNIPMQLTDMNKIKILSHATSVGNKLKQMEHRSFFVISNIVSIVSSPSDKPD